MPKYEFNQLKERYDSIPDDVQRAISSLEVANSLQEIGLKHNLHIDKVAVLAEKWLRYVRIIALVQICQHCCQ